MKKKLSRRLAGFEKKNYYLRRALKLWRISRAHQPDRETVVIYQMGKVGSSTIEHSLSALDLNINLYHVHALTHERLNWLKETYRSASAIRGKAVVHDHLVEGMYLRKQLEKKAIRNYKVITLIRDPVARNISTFFESFNVLFAKHARKYNFDLANPDVRIDDIIKLFLEEANHDLPLVWFDKYMAPVFGIDVYASEFPSTSGYEIYKGENAELLLIRLEDLDKCAKDAFHEYLGLKDFALKKTNIASEKKYSDAYSAFKSSIQLPKTYLERIYSDKFTRHFYTPQERERFMKRWTQ